MIAGNPSEEFQFIREHALSEELLTEEELEQILPLYSNPVLLYCLIDHLNWDYQRLLEPPNWLG